MKRSSCVGWARGHRLVAALVAAVWLAQGAWAQLPASTNLESYSIKIFRVESGLYPFVQAYFRTFDQDMRPLVNLNERNIGIMVKGRSYDITKMQYAVQTIRGRDEAIRSVIVIDCSKTMAGNPFDAALRAAARYIDSKRPQDQVAVLAIRDTETGYEVVSNFERDPAALGRRLADIEPDGMTTRLYDTVAAAMQMCSMASQGGIASTDAEYIISNSIIVFSDGRDEGSALERADLMTRITDLEIPIPIYSLAYSKLDPAFLKNMEALSKNSVGIYYSLGEAYDKMQSCVEDIQNILQNDYVLTFRSYVPVDGEEHAFKIGLEYPSGSGKMTYQGADFEAIEPPPVEKVLAAQQKIGAKIKALPDGDPYMKNPAAVVEQSAQPGQG